MHPAKYSSRTPPEKKNFYCVVQGCESSSKKNTELSFHAFPKIGQRSVYVKNYFDNVETIDRFKAWAQALKIKTVTGEMRVCALHFTKEDYLFPDVAAKKHFLKKNAIPSVNLPSSSGLMQSAKKKEIDRQRCERRFRRNNVKRLDTIASEKETIQLKKCDPSFQEEIGEKLEVITSDLHDPGDVSAQRLPAQSFDHSLHQSLGDSIDSSVLTNDVLTHCNKSITPELTKDIGVQVKTSDILPNFLDLFPTDSALSTATGIESYAILDCIVNLVGITLQKHPDQYNSRMSLRNKVVMTYVKLKQNITYSFLAGLFQYYTAQHCQRVFLEMIQLLSESLKVAIEWPSKKEISRNLPQCFEGFENTRAVIDCTEIFIQRPSKLCCQVICYSHYKKSETFKVMTAVTPAGNISYISNPYGGRVSDTDIFEQCDLKDLLEPGDDIMVDRGFLIDKMCAERGWKLIRPPFLKKKKQFSKSESLLTCNIAKARVHVERSNQRIKTFSILGDTMPVSLLPFAGEIFTIICATINLGSPILAKDKFMKDQ